MVCLRWRTYRLEAYSRIKINREMSYNQKRVIRTGLLRWRRVGGLFSGLLETGEAKRFFLKAYEMGGRDMCKYVRNWHPVEADKDGFATTKALDEIGNNLPVLLSRGKNCLSPDFIAISNEVDWADWQGDIAHHPERYSWRPIHL